ncbi:MAG TPA: hypothetical protein VH140_13200 [Candidatus Acidoferrum sp.]|nr:hypothetical protein [Candidatus Acidoferrum sp.]
MKKKIPHIRLAIALPLVCDSTGDGAMEPRGAAAKEVKLVPQNWQNWESS